jgi:hypothetical protein
MYSPFEFHLFPAFAFARLRISMRHSPLKKKGVGRNFLKKILQTEFSKPPET